MAKTSPPKDQQVSMLNQPKIGFVGSMNAMPMAYALKFKRDGYDVKYIVEASKENHLMRPEFHYAEEVNYPYPDWIVEIPWRNDLIGHATAPLSHRRAIAAMADRDIVFLNDSSLALGGWMPAHITCVALSAGSDLDVFGRWSMAWSLAATVRRRWLYPIRLVLELMRVGLQRKGLRRCDVLCYFPRGLNPEGDLVVKELASGPRRPPVVERYDTNFESIGIQRRALPRRPMSKILVPVRFNMSPPVGSEFEYKGNDIIIRALAQYLKHNPDLEIHLIEKGPPEDLAAAHQMCRDLGMEKNVRWHQPMPLHELLELYADSDLVFDQVGSHWIGAIGAYALYMGRPLIANARLDVFGQQWGDDVPILDARNEKQILAHLQRCEDFDERERLANSGHLFARMHLDTESVYAHLRDVSVQAWEKAGNATATLPAHQ
jgi:glycosyltransferase involved in cell wall biosynthesis